MALLAVLALLLAIVPAARQASRERANRVKCASNLRQIGQGLALYGNDFKEYPRTAWDQEQPCKADFDNAGFDSADGKTVTPNNVTAALFLLVRHCDLNPEVFVCPSSYQDKDTLGGMMVSQRSNFASGDNLSYSFTNPYPAVNGGVKLGYKWSQNVPADWAIGADRSDGTRNPAVLSNSPASQQKPLNSANHDNEGQNVLFNDGHVEWTSSAWVGAWKDNVYTRAKVIQTPKGLAQADPAATDPQGFPEPAMDLDSVLVPIFPAPPTPLSVLSWFEGKPWRSVAILLAAAVVVGVVIVRSARKPPEGAQIS